MARSPQGEQSNKENGYKEEEGGGGGRRKEEEEWQEFHKEASSMTMIIHTIIVNRDFYLVCIRRIPSPHMNQIT